MPYTCFLSVFLKAPVKICLLSGRQDLKREMTDSTFSPQLEMSAVLRNLTDEIPSSNFVLFGLSTIINQDKKYKGPSTTKVQRLGRRKATMKNRGYTDADDTK
ncbi:uncharacterized protein [Asterias amurensis]|uniref:uncharacterized protein isoform X3 n=1 Tax=Asterias amurensis TaxID=7602 RepID=UPI003AB32214